MFLCLINSLQPPAAYTPYFSAPNAYNPPMSSYLHSSAPYPIASDPHAPPSNGLELAGDVVNPEMSYSQMKPAYNPPRTEPQAANNPKSVIVIEEERRKLLNEATKKCNLGL
jgi:hypothetical protein